MPLKFLGMQLTLNVRIETQLLGRISTSGYGNADYVKRVSVCDGVRCTAQIGYSWDSLLEQPCGVRNHLFGASVVQLEHLHVGLGSTILLSG